MVGLYGDPTVSWSVLLEARLHQPESPEEIQARLAEAVRIHPNLGAPPVVRVADPSGWPAIRNEFADRSYRDSEPLVRVAVTAERLLLAAHHGAVDGLGLLAVLGLALGTPVASNVRGIGARPAAHGFVTSSALRLAEALFAPPVRAARSGQRTGPATGDAMAAVELPASRVGSAALVAATAHAVRRWNQDHGIPVQRVVAAVGASRRSGDELAPDLCTTFYRLRIPVGADPATVRRLLELTAPEPDFPPAGGTLARPVIRALSDRLGATFLASNLGVVRVGSQVRSVAFHPVATGGSGIAVGAATCTDTTTVTIRARRASFDDRAANDILGLIVAGLGLVAGGSAG